MVESKKYNKEFYDEMDINSIRSAEALLPIVNELIHPKSVVDVGCGTGSWLFVWSKFFNINDFVGIDGPYVKKEQLRIPKEKFLSCDLKESLDLDRRFDLVMSLEVGEHLPEATAETYVKSLGSLGNVVLFSAALPGQTGTYHINEQYPEYWAAKFTKNGFVAVDYLRDKIWRNQHIEFYYKQNILLFLHESIINNYPVLKDAAAKTNPDYLTRIHPFLLELKERQLQLTKTFWGYFNWRWYHFKRKHFHKDPSLHGT